MLEHKVSVLIPTYNASPFLEATLLSVVTQIRHTDEIIIIDDHSDDGSLELAKEVLKHNHPNHIAEKNLNKGACSARNRALELSTGTLIQWLDADDILGKGKIDNQRQRLQKDTACIAVAPFIPFAGTIESGIIQDNRTWPAKGEMSAASWLSKAFMTIPACWLGHRTVFEAAGPWNTLLKINQDGEYFTRVLAQAETVLFDPNIEVFYRRNLSNSVSQFSADKAESLYLSIASIHQTALGLEDSFRMRQMVANRYQHAIYSAYPHFPEGQTKAQNQLKTLPPPTISNPNALSPLSQIISQVFGWKTLTRLRLLRKELFK